MDEESLVHTTQTKLILMQFPAGALRRARAAGHTYERLLHRVGSTALATPCSHTRHPYMEICVLLGRGWKHPLLGLRCSAAL